LVLGWPEFGALAILPTSETVGAAVQGQNCPMPQLLAHFRRATWLLQFLERVETAGSAIAIQRSHAPATKTALVAAPHQSVYGLSSGRFG
jgi:hypothetical protein